MMNPLIAKNRSTPSAPYMEKGARKPCGKRAWQNSTIAMATARQPSSVGRWCGLRATATALLRFLLLLLTDANLELLGLSFLVRFPVEALGGIREIGRDVDVLGQHRHQRSGLASIGAGDAIAFDVGDRHNVFRLA